MWQRNIIDQQVTFLTINHASKDITSTKESQIATIMKLIDHEISVLKASLLCTAKNRQMEAGEVRTSAKNRLGRLVVQPQEVRVESSVAAPVVWV